MVDVVDAGALVTGGGLVELVVTSGNAPNTVVDFVEVVLVADEFAIEGEGVVITAMVLVDGFIVVGVVLLLDVVLVIVDVVKVFTVVALVVVEVNDD